MTFLRACPLARLAADAVFGMGDGHDFITHIVPVFVLSFKRLLDKFKHFPAADLIAAPAADACIHIYRLDEPRRPSPAAARIADDCHGFLLSGKGRHTTCPCNFYAIASPPVSDVLTLIALSTGETNILPSPVFPV